MDIADLGERSTIESPEELALGQIRANNLWLIRFRLGYTLFVLLYFSLINPVNADRGINRFNLILGFILPLIGTLLFWLWMKKPRKSQNQTYSQLYSLCSLQLDFDLVVLSMFVYFTGNLASPVSFLFVLYIFVASFMLISEKAFRSTLTIILLFTALFFLDRGLTPRGPELKVLLTFVLALIFSFFVAYYLAKTLKRSEKVFQRLLQKTRDLSVTDGLTGLFNQTHFFWLFSEELRKAREQNISVSLIIFDVDNFKNYNDKNGHIQGSLALRKVGSIMSSAFRKTDILAKYGGDEFVVILPKADKVGAYLAAERLREKIESTVFVGGEHQPQKRITVSLGLASFPEHGGTEEEILDLADRALYFSKESGRNRTTIYSADILMEEEPV